MEKIFKINFLFIIIIFLHSCNTLSDAGKVLRNEKIKTTDEFLVKKRDPLILPPGHSELPKPGSTQDNKNKSEKDKIKKIFKVDKDKEENNISKKNSIEKIILNKIKK